LSTGKELTTWSNTPQLPAFSLMSDPYMRPGMSPTQIWTILWAYRRLSMMILFAVLGLTAIVLLLLPRTYEATSTLLVNHEVNDPLNDKEFPIGILSNYIATQTELIRNPELLLKVVDRLKLTENKDYRSGYRGGGPASLRDYVQRKLAKNLTAYQGQAGSHLIYITAQADSPELAALIANTVTDVYKEQEFLRSTNPAVERAQRYAAQLRQLSTKVEQAQEKYTGFHQRHALLATEDGRAEAEMATLADLEEQLLDAQRTRRAAEARAAGDLRSTDEVMASTSVQSLKTQLATQEAKLAELLTTLGPRHPQVVELNSQIAASERQLNREIDNHSQNAAHGVKAARELEQKLQRAVDAQREKVLAISQLYDQSAKYRLDLESARAVYKRALDGYDQVMFASLGNYTNVDVVSRATPPVRSSKPRYEVFILLGVLLAAGAALVLPLLYELSHRRVRCRDDFERDNGVPVLVEFDSSPLVGSHA